MNDVSSMSLKKNVVANYAGLVYATVIGIVMLPFYLEFLGAEAYGLVGFFTLLMSWLGLLTAGVSPTLARQVAHYRGIGDIWGRRFREMFRSIELVVVVLAISTSLLTWLASPWLATQWLTVKTLSLDDVAYCIALMGVMVGLRWCASLYTSSLSGMEMQVWLNGFNTLFATLRYVAVYALLRWVSNEPTHYFEFQLGVSVAELVVVAMKFYSSQPATARAAGPGLIFSWPAIRELTPFAMGIAYTSMLWVFMTQSDKLILSHVLSLEEYGYFALVGVIANGVLRLSEPINQAVLPRMTNLFSRGDESAMLTLYRKVTQYMAVVVFSVAGVLALFSQPLIFALTGNKVAAEWGAPVLTWFALGNGILVLVGMQYVLQYVHGKVRMHVINTTINAAVQVPILAYVAFSYGAVAVAVAWFAIRLTTFFVWPAVVHCKFAPGLHWKWLGQDVFPPLIGVCFALSMSAWLVSKNTNLLIDRTHIFITLVVIVLIALFSGSLVTSSVRRDLRELLNRLKNVT